jgi:hypothetical protein
VRTLARSVALALLCAACPSPAVYRTADPVPPGRWQLTGGAALGGMRDVDQDTRMPTGYVELGVRRGVARDLDFGLKLYTLGIDLDATWRLARGAWSLALAPSFGGARVRYGGGSDSIYLFARTALIASRPVSRCWTFGAGPLLGWGLFWPQTGGHAQGLWAGGFAHLDARLGRGWHLTPEIGLYWVAAGEVPVRGGAIYLGAGARLDL